MTIGGNFRICSIGEVQHQSEKEYVHKSGDSVWRLTNVGVDSDADGEQLHLIMYLRISAITRVMNRSNQWFTISTNESKSSPRCTTRRACSRIMKELPGCCCRKSLTLLPAAFDHAELAAARIVFDGVEYRSPHFGSSPWTQSAHFTTAGGKHGLIEIAYAENGLNQNKRAFLAEEKSLLESITEMLQLYLDRKEAQESIDRITKELVERNKELWNLQQEMGRVGQTAALGWMAGAIAHELGTPLNSCSDIPSFWLKRICPKRPPPCQNYRKPSTAHGRDRSILSGSHTRID